MNKRILDLNAQATSAMADEIRHLERVHNRTLTSVETGEIYCEKFAELIVKECLAVLGKDRKAQLDKGDLGTAHIIQQGAISIIKHFEIKE
jgi:hypothetical protein